VSSPATIKLISAIAITAVLAFKHNSLRVDDANIVYFLFWANFSDAFYFILAEYRYMMTAELEKSPCFV
jgi:hypothetical protein